MELKIEDEFGIVSERARQRDAFAHIVKRRVDNYFSSPAGRARISREVDARLKVEVDAIIERRTRERIAEIERIQTPSGPPIGEVLVLVSDVTGCSVPELVGPRRARNVAWPRFLAVHLLLAMRPDLSLPAIGKALGGRDHTTVMHARDKFSALLDVEPICRWMADERVVALLAQRPQIVRRAPFGRPIAEAA